MSAIPMTLEDALRFSGYTIDAIEYAGKSITTPSGVIIVPPMILSTLTWRRDEPAPLGGAFYLDRLPCFNSEYADVQLSMILDRFRGRRLGYDTPDEFGLAVRRWGALHLGATSTLIRLYKTLATDLPLDTMDMVYAATSSTTATSDATSEAESAGTGTDGVTTADNTTTTTTGRDAQSDFPHGMLAGDGSYASDAVDRTGTGTVTGGGTTTANRDTTGTSSSTDHKEDATTADDLRTEKGRAGRTVMELLEQQRAAFVNADMLLLSELETLFLGVFDRAETFGGPGPGFYGSRSWGW